MNTYQLLAAFIRIVGIQYFLTGVLVFTNVPERLLLAAHAQPSLASAATSGLLALGFRCLVYVVIAVCLWVLAEPLAKLVSRGVPHDT